MFQEFINYLKYIGFISEETFKIFSSEFESFPEPENSNNNPKMKIITTMRNYIKALSEEQILKIMGSIYDRYSENKIKISSKKLLNLIKIYRNKELKFYMIYWNKLSQYLMHKEIQKYQLYQTNNKSDDNFDSKALNNNSNIISKSNNKISFPNNISIIKQRNSDINNVTAKQKTKNVLNIRPKSLSKEFILRQEKFIKMKKQNLMKNIDNNEEEFQSLYTFKPCLVKTMNSFTGNNKLRNENLYNNKLHEWRIRNLREVIDNERGYTFKPKINNYRNSNAIKNK